MQNLPVQWQKVNRKDQVQNIREWDEGYEELETFPCVGGGARAGRRELG